MDEILAIVGGGLLCVLPIGLLIYLAVKSGQNGQLRATVLHHEEGLHQLGQQILRLHQRIAQLESRPVDAVAPAQAAFGQPVAPAQPATQPVTPTAPHDPNAPIVVAAEQARWEPAAAARQALQPDAQPQAAMQLGPEAQPAQAHQVPVEQAASQQAAFGPAAHQQSVQHVPQGFGATSPVQGPQGAVGGGAMPPTQPPQQPPGGAGPAPKPERTIAWEEWIGVRGAAALGGALLVLAALYFFKYSIDHGWINETARFVIGLSFGIGCIALAELKLRPRYTVLASWLTGGGFGILYIASWAGRALYELYPSPVAAVLMIAVTLSCVALALKRESFAVAVLGLLGGFITPLALSTGQDHPIPLFGYLLILDLALLYVAYKKRWFGLAVMCIIGTFVYQVGWLFGRMDDDSRWIGAAVLCVFALPFALIPPRDDSAAAWRRIRYVAVLLPLLLSVALGFRSDLSAHLVATGIQLVVLGAAAAVLGRQTGMGSLAVAAALACQGTLLGTVVYHVNTQLEAWSVTMISLCVAFVFYVSSEVGSREQREQASNGAVAAALSALGLGFFMVYAPPVATQAAVMLLAMPSIFVIRMAAHRGPWTSLPIGSLAVGGLGVAFLFIDRSGMEGMASTTTNLGLLVLTALAAQFGGVLLARQEKAARAADHGAALVALFFLFATAMVDRFTLHPALPLHLAGFVLTLAMLFAAARRGLGGWVSAAAVAAALTDSLMLTRPGYNAALLFAMLVAKVLFIAASPFLFPRLGRSHWAWRGAGLAALLALFPLRVAFIDMFGTRFQGALPLAIALIYIAGAFVVRKRPPEEKTVALSATVWFIGAAAALITIAIPMQLEKQWVTIGWALEVLVFTALWRRYDHAGLKYTALALASVVLIRLVFNPFVLDYQLRSSWRVLNWISYTYLVPAFALLAAHTLMSPLEAVRRRTWEPGPAGKPIIAPTFGAGAILLLFVWINLMVFDFFATGPNLTIPTDRMPARDLTTSMAWALYAIGLLTVGVMRGSKGLRYASLILLLLTCLKVFLYDLGHLEELYLVASLVGLALTLIVISLAYKRFVFTESDEPSKPSGPSGSGHAPGPAAGSGDQPAPTQEQR